MCDLIEEFLKQLGLKKISKVVNGQEALVKLRLGDVKPDLIICDLKMPVMDGFEFIEIIRGHRGLEFKDIPILVMTGSAKQESLSKVIKLGIHGYLVKPVTQEELRKQISHALTSPMISASRIN